MSGDTLKIKMMMKWATELGEAPKFARDSVFWRK
jgi:hypothetical protein